MLAKVNRIRKRQDFSRIFRSGTSFRSQHLRLHVVRTPKNKRWSITISTKISKKAVVRNRLRRRLNGFIREYWPQLQENIDVVIVVTRDFSQLETTALRQEFLKLCSQANILTGLGGSKG